MPKTSDLRLFTVEEANALLPRLRPLVERLQERVERIRETVERARTESGLPPGDPDLSRLLEERHDVAALGAEAGRLIDEIQSSGALVNGAAEGLVDFPALLDGEIVFLCWRNPEPSVLHWHRIEDGFAGRRPLLELEEAPPADEEPPVH